MSTKNRLELLARVIMQFEKRQEDLPGYAEDIARVIVATELKRLAWETERVCWLERDARAERRP